MDERILKEAGLKATPRRKAMLRILLESECPLTAEEVYRSLSGERKCDLSTVYRALNTMAEHRLLQKTYTGTARFIISLTWSTTATSLSASAAMKASQLIYVPLNSLNATCGRTPATGLPGTDLKSAAFVPGVRKRRGRKNNKK